MGSHVLWPSVFPEFPRQNFLETSAEYIYKGISSTTLLVLFLEHSTDWQIDLLFWVLIYPANCVAKNFFLNLSKMKHVTNYIQNISFSPASQQFTRPWSESLFLTKWELLTSFFISWRMLTECYSKLPPTTSATCRLFSCTFQGLWYCPTFGYVAKIQLLHVVITSEIALCFISWCLFRLTKFSIWRTPATR